MIRMNPVTHADNSESSRRIQLLKLLCDGEFHSGEVLAERLGITRAAVWKIIGALRDEGVTVESHPRQGYHLPFPVQLYDAAAISESLAPASRNRLQRIDVLMSVDSTNQHVSTAPASKDDHAVLCVAEIQTAGRGRRGRSWLAPFGSGICMSLGYLFNEVPNGFSALTLVVGVALMRGLHECGVRDAKLKWPNDVVVGGRKLAGVLTEMRGEAAGPTHVVIGVGCNLRLPQTARDEIAQTHGVIDLHEVLHNELPDRNKLVGMFASHLIECMVGFARDGFTAFVHEWQRHDALRHSEVKVLHGDQVILGVACGVTEDGSLLIETPQGIQRFTSAEVSLRANAQ